MPTNYDPYKDKDNFWNNLNQNKMFDFNNIMALK